MKKLLFLSTLTAIVLTMYFLSQYKKDESKTDKNFLFSIKQDDTEIVFYGLKPSLDVGINRILIKSNKRVNQVYFYMPPMPGMGEMREDVELKEISSGSYEGKVNISMAGGWQVVVVTENKKLTYNLNIPFKANSIPKESQQNVIVLDSQKKNLLGIQTEKVEFKDFVEGFNGIGYVSYDMSKIKKLTVKSDGWVVDTYGRFEGEEIKKGTPLLKILNPDVEITKEELKLAKEIGREDLEKAVLDKLRYLGKGNTITSPWNGVIVKKNVADGGFAKAGETLYEIADTSTLWIIGEVPQIYASFLKRGMEVLIKPIENEDFITGKIDYIFPEADKVAKTLKIRIKADSTHNLKVNQILDIYVENTLKNVLVVPSSAIVDTGTKQIVFLESEDGKYIPKKVKIGKCNIDYCQVLDGLKEGDKVVVKGNFMLDSEAQIKNIY